MPVTTRHTLALAVALTVFALAGCTPAKPAETASPSQPSSEQSPTAMPDAPKVEDLKDLKLSEREEGLIFDYIVAGGLKALESRFGKPAATYSTAADESSTGSAELADGRAYQVQCGLDKRGAAVVMAHGVSAQKGQTPTPADTAFIKAMVDGKTTLDEANAYLKQTGAPTVRPAKMDPKGLNVPAYVWALDDGAGFMAVDLSSLTPEQAEQIGVDSEVPFQALYWDATRWRAY